ncbi:hypothetical protein NE237_027492 [Protea cynaroides]|uniref:Photolyase/cryptochrome alpha/beta domain-containing protein n=1 Tax=Protea cynaroides TaxID=273540 RepID=A0A9Q0JU99_9MAGN|nr:hypothetical protein NE237_027492 [Protea cynaroides]
MEEMGRHWRKKKKRSQNCKLMERCRFFSASARAQVDVKRKKDDDVALLWFKHDLRSDDHPGLVAASQSQTVVSLYIFDHRILSCFSDEMLELVVLALEDLREWLKSQGSNLMIRFVSAENVMLELVQEVKATHVFSEEEVEYNLRRIIDIIEGSMSSVTFSWGSPQLVRWQTPFYDIKVFHFAPIELCCLVLDLALKSQLSREGRFSIRIWRWNGYLIQIV